MSSPYRALPALCALAMAGCNASTPPSAGMRGLVHAEKSLYGNIYVFERDGLRCMNFGRTDGRQGCLDPAQPQRLALPYVAALTGVLFADPEPRSVLVIGLGIGSFPAALRSYAPDARIDTVELDPAVLATAQRHFGFREDARSRVHIDDGRVFVRKQRRAGARYDLVVLDAFDIKYIPEHLLTREFLSELRELLEPGGIVAANTFSRGALQPHELATYQAVFGDTLVLDAGTGNRIILCGRDGMPGIARLRDNAARIAPRLAPFGVNAPELATGLRTAARVAGVAPLTDQYSPANLLSY